MTHLNAYQFLHNGLLRLTFSNGEEKLIQISENSGRIVSRKKADTIFDVNHPGIFVGEEVDTNEAFILHNHYKVFKAAGVSPKWEYAAEQKVVWDNRTFVNDKMTILRKGLDLVVSREEYHWLNYNCQVMVSDACNNERKTEDIGKWVRRVGAGLACLLILSLIVTIFHHMVT